MDHEKALSDLKEHARKREERWATMTPEAAKKECRDYLVRLGTHNHDGTLTPQYGGPDINGGLAQCSVFRNPASHSETQVDLTVKPMTVMRAKMRIGHIDERNLPYSETLHFHAVAASKYPEDGSDENNTYAKFSPSGILQLTIANPDLLGNFTTGEEYYLDFTLASVAD